jgi:isocitrate dehydrogenase
LDRINPGSLILSGLLMLEYLGWQEAADLMRKGVATAIANREVTYDLARMMDPPVDKSLKCSEFADAIISHF